LVKLLKFLSDLRNKFCIEKEADASLLAKAYIKTFSSYEGKRVLNDLALRANMYISSYTQADPYTTVFREGQRSLFLHILYNLDETYTIETIHEREQ